MEDAEQKAMRSRDLDLGGAAESGSAGELILIA
jgi:hypothetical protein